MVERGFLLFDGVICQPLEYLSFSPYLNLRVELEVEHETWKPFVLVGELMCLDGLSHYRIGFHSHGFVLNVSYDPFSIVPFLQLFY